MLSAALLACGCSTPYTGGKVVDGTNLELGVTVPGTDKVLNLNLLSYTGGVKVEGGERTSISVTNEVAETNTYLFGAVEFNRRSRTSASIVPVEDDPPRDAERRDGGD